MRYFIIVFAIIFGFIFVGGYVNLGGAPVFAHMDRMLGTNMFMKMHKTTFFFLYRGGHDVRDGVRRTEEDLKDFEQRPLGIDRKREYKRLDEASQY